LVAGFGYVCPVDFALFPHTGYVTVGYGYGCVCGWFDLRLPVTLSFVAGLRTFCLLFDLLRLRLRCLRYRLFTDYVVVYVYVAPPHRVGYAVVYPVDVWLLRLHHTLYVYHGFHTVFVVGYVGWCVVTFATLFPVCVYVYVLLLPRSPFTFVVPVWLLVIVYLRFGSGLLRCVCAVALLTFGYWFHTYDPLTGIYGYTFTFRYPVTFRLVVGCTVGYVTRCCCGYFDVWLFTFVCVGCVYFRLLVVVVDLVAPLLTFLRLYVYGCYTAVVGCHSTFTVVYCLRLPFAFSFTLYGYTHVACDLPLLYTFVVVPLPRLVTTRWLVTGCWLVVVALRCYVTLYVYHTFTFDSTTRSRLRFTFPVGCLIVRCDTPFVTLLLFPVCCYGLPFTRLLDCCVDLRCCVYIVDVIVYVIVIVY